MDETTENNILQTGLMVGQGTPYPYNQLAQSISMGKRIEVALRDAELRLKELKEADAILQRNPDLQRLLDIMNKGRF